MPRIIESAEKGSTRRPILATRPEVTQAREGPPYPAGGEISVNQWSTVDFAACGQPTMTDRTEHGLRLRGRAGRR